MIRKSIMALAALATIGTAALTPNTASAYWGGYGHRYYGWGGGYRYYGGWGGGYRSYGGGYRAYGYGPYRWGGRRW